ncbi:MAG: hypothetical protein HKN43_13375 [Rhodothermales bacterium]|nr:hypothetical protein [Rhodothermales bacterium]
MLFNTDAFKNLEYRMVGPSRGGRVTAVAGHASRPSYFLMGATGGGLWETTNYGSSWKNISDGYFHTGSIGSIDISDSNPEIIFVGTGSDGIRSNVIIGRGIYKSTDAGSSWNRVGLENAGQLASVVIHPTNPDVVYVAAMGSPFGPGEERGVYRTIDGGDTWEKVLFVSNQTGAVDIELHPSEPDIVYAAVWRAERKPWTIISGDDSESGIFRSTDGGASWSRITAGLPGGLVGKIDFAVSEADPSRVYALIETEPENEGLYRSNDSGQNWRLISNQAGLMNRPFYYTNVDADPSDADVVYVGNEGFYKSTDAGASFKRLSTPHGDNHDLWINPDDGNIFVQSNDGGANVTVDGGETWSTQLNQPTAELYQVHVDDRFPYWLYAGQQDNSTIAVPSYPPDYRPGGPRAYWDAIGGCETGPVVPKPGDPNIVYANCKGRFGRYNRATGEEMQFYVGAVDMYGRNPAELPYRFQRVVPIEVSPHDPDVVYHGSQFVHRTINDGATWETISPDLTAFRPERQVVSGGPITRDITGEEHYSTLYVIEESPFEQGVIWTGANDGPVHVSTDNGDSWRNVTPPDLPPEGRIQSIEPSPHDAGKAYVAAYRYLLNDFEPYIFKTTDYGLTWTRLTTGTNGIPPDTPTRVVREDTERPGLLYAGTEFGMYISYDDGESWDSFQQNLPVTPVTDIKVVDTDLVLSTMGRSFWILDNVNPIRLWSSEVADSDFYVFPITDAILIRDRSSQRTATDPAYPSPGPSIDFYVGIELDDVIHIDITDSDDNLIRSFASDSAGIDDDLEQGMREPPITMISDRLSTNIGFHRFTWDMRHYGPINRRGSRNRGPLVKPGTYTAKVRVGDVVSNREFDVTLDPRVAADGVTQDDLALQESISLQLRDLATSMNTLLSEVDETIASAPDSTAEYVTGLKELRSKVETSTDDSYPPRMFDRQLGYLMSMVARASHRPGDDALKRLSELEAEWKELEMKLRNAQTVDDPSN